MNNRSSTIYFGGCSITMGTGFESQQQDSRIYPNLVAGAINHKIINDAEGGSSNLKIFIKAAKAMIDNFADIYVVQWSAPHRHWLYPRPDQGIYLGSMSENNDYRDFVQIFQQLNHDYTNLMSVIDYSRILTDIAQQKSKQLIFVNGMLFWKNDWNDDYMRRLVEDLDADSQQDFQERFTNNLELLDIDIWANPWISIIEMQIDDAPLDAHPGANTHRRIADLVLDRLGDKR